MKLWTEVHPDADVWACSTALENAFGGEWRTLSPECKRAILIDFTNAVVAEETLSASEYRRRIWAGNLRKYARTLIRQAERYRALID